MLMRVRPAPLAVVIKTLLGVRRIEAQTPEGRFWLDPASEFGQRLLTLGIYEPDSIAALKGILKPGGTFADVGANEGYFSVLASAIVGNAGRVLAVEPQNRLQEVLRRNFALNNAENVTLAAVAVTAEPGVAELSLAASMNTGASSLTGRARYKLERQTVPTVTLSALVEEWGVDRVDLLKMDIEGSEHEAIFGSRSLFESGLVRAIVLELHHDHLRARGLGEKAIVDFLLGCGYRQAAGFEALVYLLPGTAA